MGCCHRLEGCTGQRLQPHKRCGSWQKARGRSAAGGRGAEVSTHSENAAGRFWPPSVHPPGRQPQTAPYLMVQTATDMLHTLMLLLRVAASAAASSVPSKARDKSTLALCMPCIKGSLGLIRPGTGVPGKYGHACAEPTAGPYTLSLHSAQVRVPLPWE